MQPRWVGGELFVGPVAHLTVNLRRRESRRTVGVAVVRSTPARRPAATAPGWTTEAGCVPALSAGAPVIERHSATASWERAELAVHTNSADCGRSDACGRR